jgi:hypothetical protein
VNFQLQPGYKLITEPVVGTALRFAPSVGGKMAAFMWRLWIQGNDIYAAYRRGGEMMHFSVHSSGQIHLRYVQSKQLAILAPAMLLPGRAWLHAIYLRFLLTPGNLPPPTERRLKKNQRGYLYNVDAGNVLMMSLLRATAKANVPPPLPDNFPDAQILWSAALADGSPVVLIAKTREINKQDRDDLQRLRHQQRLRVNFKAAIPAAAYLELWEIERGGDGSNLITIVPQGADALVAEGEAAPGGQP